ncbi:hypothetical protein [Baekduia sp.]|uniref:hypothetical protein n=1 Tax=Baekduia sp. TaxID=2600305 RepID=UPI002E0179A2|nr:hypothetical protein [Baekduia sp.]
MSSPRLVLVLLLGVLAIFAGAFAVGRVSRPQAAEAGAGATLETLPAVSRTAAVPVLGKVARLPALRVRHRARTPSASTADTVQTPSTTVTGVPSDTSLAPATSGTSSGSTKATTPKKATAKKTTPSGGGDVSSGGNSLGG